MDNSPKEHEGSRALVADRPLVLCPAEDLPFADKAFDFSITFHTLEHSTDPAAFLSELQRVSKAGYIETPSPINEILYPYKFHRSFVGLIDGQLMVRMKKTWDDPFPDSARDMVDSFRREKEFMRFYRRNPRLFNTSFYWEGHIKFHVWDDGPPRSWPDIYQGVDHPHHERGFSAKTVLRKYLPRMIRQTMGYTRRNVQIEHLLKCKGCNGFGFSKKQKGHLRFELNCNNCHHSIESKNNVVSPSNFSA